MGGPRRWLTGSRSTFDRSCEQLAALALYQKAGWRLSALRGGAIDAIRGSIKPSIPELGQHGIPLRDELELELAP